MSKSATPAIRPSCLLTLIIFIIFLITICVIAYINKPPEPPKPLPMIPISMTFREGFTGGILQIHKTTSEEVNCNLKIFDSYETEVINYNFKIIWYYDKLELGKLEIGRQLKTGDHGVITANGYSGNVKFNILENNGERYINYEITQ